ncbi:MAG: hypothetical protein N3A60_08440 [Thermanaerothrix sp.]|nr:hypothetical protein [Thermanaerothrix sp.]
MTLKVGEAWAVAHAKRLIERVREISGNLAHDAQIIELAAYMHDWGAFPKYARKDVEHAIRCCQVFEAEILPYLLLTVDQSMHLLEAVEFYDYRDPRRTVSNEVLLMREADMLEFIRMIGMAREFARGAPKRGHLLPAHTYPAGWNSGAFHPAAGARDCPSPPGTDGDRLGMAGRGKFWGDVVALPA